MPSGPKKRKAARKQKQADGTTSPKWEQDQREGSQEREKVMDDDAEAIAGEASCESTEPVRATERDETGDSKRSGKEQDISSQVGELENEIRSKEASASVLHVDVTDTPDQQDGAAKDQTHEDISASISDAAIVEKDGRLKADGQAIITDSSKHHRNAPIETHKYSKAQTKLRNIELETEAGFATDLCGIAPVQERIEDSAQPWKPELGPDNHAPVEPKAEDTARVPYVESSPDSQAGFNKSIAEPQVVLDETHGIDDFAQPRITESEPDYNSPGEPKAEDTAIELCVQKTRALRHESLPNESTQSEIISQLDTVAHLEVEAPIGDESEGVFDTAAKRKTVVLQSIPNVEFTDRVTKSEEIGITGTEFSDKAFVQDQKGIMQSELDQGFDAKNKTNHRSLPSLIEEVADVKIEEILELKHENSSINCEVIDYSSVVETELSEAELISEVNFEPCMGDKTELNGFSNAEVEIETVTTKFAEAAELKVTPMIETEPEGAGIPVTEFSVPQCHKDLMPVSDQTSEKDISGTFVSTEDQCKADLGSRSKEEVPVDDGMQVKVKAISLAEFEPLSEVETLTEDATELEMIQESMVSSEVLMVKEVALIQTQKETLNVQVESRSNQDSVTDVQKGGTYDQTEAILPVHIETQLETGIPARDKVEPEGTNDSTVIYRTLTSSFSTGSETEFMMKTAENAVQLVAADSSEKASVSDQPYKMPLSNAEIKDMPTLVEETMAVQAEEILEAQYETNSIEVPVDGDAPNDLKRIEAATISPVYVESLLEPITVESEREMMPSAEIDLEAGNPAISPVRTVRESLKLDESPRPKDENEGSNLIEEVMVTEIDQGGIKACVSQDADNEEHKYSATQKEIEPFLHKKQESSAIKEAIEASLVEEVKEGLGPEDIQVSSSSIEGELKGVITERSMEYDIVVGQELQNSKGVTECDDCAIDELSVNEQERDGEDDTMSSLIAEVGSAHTDLDLQELDSVLSSTDLEESNFNNKVFTVRLASPESVDLCFKNEDSGENHCIEHDKSNEENIRLCVSDSYVKESYVSTRIMSEEFDSIEAVTSDIDADKEVVKDVCEPCVTEEVIIRSTPSEFSAKTVIDDIEKVVLEELDPGQADIVTDTEVVKSVCEPCVREEVIVSKSVNGDIERVVPEELDSAEAVGNFDAYIEVVKYVGEPCIADKIIVSAVEDANPFHKLENPIFETEGNVGENLGKNENSIDYTVKNAEIVSELELNENPEHGKFISFYGNKWKQAAILPEERIEFSQENAVSVKGEEKLLEGTSYANEVTTECLDPSGDNMPTYNTTGAGNQHLESSQGGIPVLTSPTEITVEDVNDIDEGKSFAPRKIANTSNWLGCCGLLDLLLSKDR